MQTATWKRWVGGALVLLTLAVTSALAVGWLAFQHIPAWYDPPQLTPDDLPGVRASLPSIYQEFTDRLAEGGRFEFKLAARAVNEWIAARADLWPDARQITPSWIKEPVMAFVDDRVVVGARYERGDWRAIVSAHFEVAVEGNTLVIRLTKLAAGSLPVPMTMITDTLDKHLADLLGERRSLPGRLDRLSTGMERLDSVRMQHEGWPLENRLYWSNGERYFRLLDVHADDGWLVLRVETL